MECPNAKVHVSYVDGRAQDLCFVELPVTVNAFPDLTVHTAPARDHEFYPEVGFATELVSVTRGATAYVQGTSAVYSEDPKVGSFPWLGFDACYETPIVTKQGQCGSLLVHSSSDCIIGMHLGFDPVARTSVFLLLAREMLDACVTTMPLQVLREGGYLRGDVEISLPESEIDILCTVPKPFTPLGTNLRPVEMDVKALTNIFGQEVKEMAPAVLAKTDCRFKPAYAGDSPLLRGIHKYSHSSNYVIDAKAMAKAVVTTCNALGTTHIEPRVLTVDEALNGVSVDGKRAEEFGDHIDLTTSAGIPFCDAKIKRKDLIKLKSGRLTLVTVLEDKLINRRELAENGLIPHDSTWKDFSKDELLPQSKIDRGKTRHITAAPLDHLILSKMYFGAFAAHLTRGRIKNGSGIGINCESLEFDDAISGLREFGDKFIDLDFSNYDGTVPPEFARAALDVIENFYYGCPEKDKAVRKVLIEETLFTVARAEGFTYLKNKGTPSGCYTTATVGMIINLLLNAYCFYQMNPNGARFDDYVKLLGYVDDMVEAVRTERCEKDGVTYDPFSLAQSLSGLGMTATSGDKTGVPRWIEFSDLVYLKRRAVVNAEGLYQPMIDPQTIYKIVMWARSSPFSRPKMWLQRAEAALVFTFFYGEEKFRAMREFLGEHSRNYSGSRAQLPTYPDLKRRYNYGLMREILEIAGVDE